jgi:hypothetical protein
MARRGFNRNESGPTALENFGSSTGSIFTLKPQAKYLTGARTILRINGSVVAFAFSVSWSAKTDATEIYTIDDALPWEIAPQRIQVSGTLGLFQLPGQSPLVSRFQSDPATFLMNKYISIEVKDSSTDAIIFKAGSAMVTGQQGEIASEQMGRLTLTWKAVGWQAENPPTPFTTDEMKADPDSLDAGPLSPQGIKSFVKGKFGL